MTTSEIAVVTSTLRSQINASGYGSFVSDSQLRELAIQILKALDAHRKKGK